MHPELSADEQDVEHSHSKGASTDARVDLLTRQMINYIETSGYRFAYTMSPATGAVQCVAEWAGGNPRFVTSCHDGDEEGRMHRAVRRLLHLVAADMRQRLAA